MIKYPSPEIGIIGGTGIYDVDLLSNCRKVKISTPYGSPSDLITIGEYKSRIVAFIPRHGKGHLLPPHKINSRANIWAMKSLGISRIIAPSAVGSLQDMYRPGDIVLPDQFIDFTKNRNYSFFDGNQVCHVSCADPFCSEMNSIVYQISKNLGFRTHNKCTYICIEGPRFSTRGESRYYKEVVHGDIIGMTLIPECILALEQQICYLSIATVTDYDVWSERPVSSSEIIEVLNKNAEKIRKLVSALLPEIPKIRKECLCYNALENALV